MQLADKHIVNAARSKVWGILMDTETLARIVPGISSLEKIADNSFTSTVSIKIGPVNSSFAGNLEMEDIREEKGFILKILQNSKVGNANALIKIEMVTVGENQTEVSFDGDIKLSGMLASMGQILVGAVANSLSKQFFDNIEKELNGQSQKGIDNFLLIG